MAFTDEKKQAPPRLSPAQMRGLRLLYDCDVYTPADPQRKAALALSTAQALQLAGYATVKRLDRHYGGWAASITKEGEAKVCPPPLKPNMSLTMFLITAPDFATNSESGADALGILASCLREGARAARRARDIDLAKELEKASEKVLGRDPDFVRWPVSLRFQGAGFQFFDYIAQRCLEREEG